jgi:hypothetical protein
VTDARKATGEPASAVGDEELRAELERVLHEHFEAERRLVALKRCRSPYQTSFALEELDVTLEDGATLELVFKDLSPHALSAGARAAKPSFLYDPSREIETYRSILTRAELGTPIYYGALADPERSRYWLFLERVPGVALWQIGELESWKQAARWLARMHDHFADTEEWRRSAGHLLHYDARFYRLWPQRARDFIDRAAPSEVARGAVEWLEARYEQVVERLASLPDTFIHGEFYASNVLVAGTAEALRVCPIDWEISAVGPGLIDLAALVSGKWEKEETIALASAYRSALGSRAGLPRDGEDFNETLDYCRLHLAVQWIGWAQNWSPPAEHRQDWLGEALRLAEELGL